MCSTNGNYFYYQEKNANNQKIKLRFYYIYGMAIYVVQGKKNPTSINSSLMCTWLTPSELKDFFLLQYAKYYEFKRYSGINVHGILGIGKLLLF